jgi:co-chaperonin GroES (HSP10)
MTLNPHLVLIKVDKPREVDEFGVHIQEEWKTQEPTGEVLEVGADVTVCKKGDKVWFERFSAIKTPLGEDTRACRDTAILAVL